MVFFCPIFQSLRLHLHDGVLSSIHSAIQPHPPSKPRRAGIKMLFLCKFPVKRTPHFHSGFAVHCPSWEIAAYCPHLIAHKHNLRPHRCVWMQSISAPPPTPQKKKFNLILHDLAAPYLWEMCVPLHWQLPVWLLSLYSNCQWVMASSCVDVSHLGNVVVGDWRAKCRTSQIWFESRNVMWKGHDIRDTCPT